MKKVMYKSSLTNFLRHPWQFVLSVLGIALGVAVVISIDLANESSKKAFKLSFESVAGKATHYIVGGPAGVPDSVYRKIRIDFHFGKCAPIIESHVVFPDRNIPPKTLLGVDFFAEEKFRNYFAQLNADSKMAMKDFFVRPDAVILSKQSAEELGLRPGDQFSVEINIKEFKLKLVDVLIPANERDRVFLKQLILTDIATAKTLLDMPHHLSRIDILIENESDEKFLHDLQDYLPAGLQIKESRMRTRSAQQMVKSFHLNLTAMSFLALVVGMFLIFNTMTFSVVQRRNFIGLLRALGVTRKEIFGIIIFEAIVLGIFGTIIGVFGGILLARVMVHLVTQSINDLYFVLSVEKMFLSLGSLGKAIFLGIGATLLATIKPAREATDAPPRVVMSRSLLESSIRSNIKKLTAAGLALGILGIFILFSPSRNIWISYSGLIPLMLGLSLLSPLTISLFSQILQPIMKKAFGILGKMATRGIVTQISRTSVAIAALSIAVATTIGVGSMVKSFRYTVQDWLSNLLSADIFISAQRLVAAQSSGDIDFSYAEKIAQFPEVLHVNYYREHMIESEKGTFIFLTAKMGEHRYNDFRFKAGDPKTAWPAYEWEEAALVSETYAYRFNVHLGDSLELPTDFGKKKFKIVGIYYDYGSDLGLASVVYRTYRKYWRDDKLSGILVYVKEGQSADSLMAKIRKLFPPDEDIVIQSNKSLYNKSIEVFDRTFLITSVLQTLAIIVAFIGVLSALMAIQLERHREFGVLRATGLTPGQLWKMVLMQTGIMGLIAGILALPMGYVLAQVLIKVINERAFGWTIYFKWIPGLYLQAILLSIIAALIAGIYPAFKMAKTSPAVALREE